MTDQEINIAVATACGWNEKPEPPIANPGIGFPAEKPKWWYPYQLPDYCNDLNEMHAAEMTCLRSCSAVEQYRRKLIDVLVEKHCVEADICAHAAQRAEAFLKTIGKWK